MSTRTARELSESDVRLGTLLLSIGTEVGGVDLVIDREPSGHDAIDL